MYAHARYVPLQSPARTPSQRSETDPAPILARSGQLRSRHLNGEQARFLTVVHKLYAHELGAVVAPAIANRPLEKFIVPAELDGSGGLYRRPQRKARRPSHQLRRSLGFTAVNLYRGRAAPLATLLVYLLSTGGDLVAVFKAPRRILGFLWIAGSGLFVGLLVVLGAMLREREGSCPLIAPKDARSSLQMRALFTPWP